jgi:hypothetical protein
VGRSTVWAILASAAGLAFGVVAGGGLALAAMTLAATTQLLFARHLAGERTRAAGPRADPATGPDG